MAILDFYLTEASNQTGDAANDITTSASAAEVLLTNAAQVTLSVYEPKIFTAFSLYGADAASLAAMTDTQFFQIMNADSAVLFELCVIADGTLRIRDYCYSDGVAVDTDLTEAITTAYQRFDVEFNAATDGVIRLYLDGTLVFERTGDTSYLSTDQIITNVNLFSPTLDNNVTYLKNFFVTDTATDARTVEMVYQPATGDGKYGQFSGDYADVTGTELNDATVMTGPQGARHTFSLDDLPAEYDAHTLLAVGMHVRCQSDDDGIIEYAPMICSASTDDELAYGFPASSVGEFAPVRAIFDTAPDGSAWDHAKYSDLEIGIKTS